MSKCFKSGRGKIVASVVFSIVLHAFLGLAWLSLRPERSASHANSPTAVDGPDEGDFVITLREPPQVIIAQPAPPEPRQLLPEIEIPRVSPSEGPGAIVPTENLRPTTPSASQPVLGSLHERFKAGRSIAYVIDRSSSMGSDGQLRAACKAVRASLQQLSPESRFQIVAYNAASTMLASQPLPATEDNKLRAIRWLDTLLAEGSSNHLVGLREALWQQPDAVFLLTDADDLEAKEVKAIASLVRDRVLLNAVLFGSGLRTIETPLQRLCESTGGTIAVR